MLNGLGLPLQLPRNRFYSLSDLRRDKQRARALYAFFDKNVYTKLHKSMNDYLQIIKKHYSV